MFDSKPAKEVAHRLGVPWPPANGYFTFKLPTNTKGQVSVLLLTDTEVVFGQQRLPLWSSRTSLSGGYLIIEGIDQDIVLPVPVKDSPASIVAKLKSLERAMPEDPEIEALRATRRQKREALIQGETAKAAQHAEVGKLKIAFLESITLHANGDLQREAGGQRSNIGNVIGAGARVDQSGAERVFRDTRQAFITIEGPHVSFSHTLKGEDKWSVQSARQFAAKVNQVSQQQSEQDQRQPVHVPAPAPAMAPAPAPDIPEQIRKLGELKQQGLLTEEEFAAKKTDLLGRL